MHGERRSDVIADRRAYPRVAVENGRLKDRRRTGKPGRPSIDPTGRSERISTRVCGETFDALCRLASKHGVELAEFVRDRLDGIALEDGSVAKTRQPRPSAAI